MKQQQAWRSALWLRATAVGVGRRIAELDGLVDAEEARLRQRLAAEVPAREHQARLQRATEALVAEARAIEAAPRSAPTRNSEKRAVAKVVAAVEAMEARVTATSARCAKLAAASASWQARAEAAVRAGDDDAARYALRAKAATDTAATAMRAEIEACREAVVEWRKLAAR